jgi:hypothetical protein
MTFDAVVDAIGQIEAKRHWHAVAAKPPAPTMAGATRA